MERWIKWIITVIEAVFVFSILYALYLVVEMAV